MRNRRIGILLVSAALFALAFPVAAQANHAWGNYHWERASNPVSLSLGDNVSGHWDARLVTASGDWNQSSVLDTSVVRGHTKPRQCRPTAGMVEVCNDSYGGTGWLGIAQIWANGDHIAQGVVKLNDYYHDRAPYDSDDWRQLVICQEVGHTFGLGHQNEDFSTDLTTSCMEYTSDPAGNTSPDQHDFDQLAEIYAHLDSSGGGGGGGSGGPPGGCRGKKCGADHAEFGRLVASSGNVSTYARPDGRYTLITHVTWVPGHEGDHDH